MTFFLDLIKQFSKYSLIRNIEIDNDKLWVIRNFTTMSDIRIMKAEKSL